MAAKPLTVISIFSGGMGLDVGLEQTGRYDLLAAVEVDPIFCETIRVNRDAGRIGSPDTRVYNIDIRNLDPQTLLDDLGLKAGELDLLVGGPPCQAFSTSGRRQSVEDRRGTLLWDFIRFVEVLQPKFFLMENVRGLVSAALRHRPISDRPERGGKPLAADEQPGSVLRQFAADLSAQGGSRYRVDAFEVNAANYGAAQIRERLLCIGNRMGHVVEFPEPTHGAEAGSSERRFTTLGDVIGTLAETRPEVLDFSPRKKSFLRMVPPGGNWRSLPEEIQRESMGRAFHAKGGRSGWWRRLSMDLPCPTIVTMPNHASTSLCHPTEVRALSVRECALIQGFPHDWSFAGRTQDKYVQIGNAVPTVLGRVAGNVIADHLDSVEVRTNSHDVDDFRVVYLRSHIRTRRWFSKGKSVVWGQGDAETAAYSAPVTQRRERALGAAC